jgi:acyl carrier protein
MNSDELRNVVLDTLKGIAPEIEADRLDAAAPLRDQVDLDSMDWLNFLIALHQRLDIDIPEVDYARLTSIDALVAYLSAKHAN